MVENESRHELVRAVHSIHIRKTCIARDVSGIRLFAREVSGGRACATSGTAFLCHLGYCRGCRALSCWTAVFAVKAIGSAKSASSSEGTDLAVELGVGSVASLLAAGLAWMFERSGGTSSLAAAAPCSPVAARCSAWARLCAASPAAAGDRCAARGAAPPLLPCLWLRA